MPQPFCATWTSAKRVFGTTGHSDLRKTGLWQKDGRFSAVAVLMSAKPASNRHLDSYIWQTERSKDRCSFSWDLKVKGRFVPNSVIVPWGQVYRDTLIVWQRYVWNCRTQVFMTLLCNWTYFLILIFVSNECPNNWKTLINLNNTDNKSVVVHDLRWDYLHRLILHFRSRSRDHRLTWTSKNRI